MTSTLNNSYTASVIGLVMVMFSTSSTASPATDFFSLSTIPQLRESAKQQANREHVRQLDESHYRQEREMEQLRYENERKLIEQRKRRKPKPSGTRKTAERVEGCRGVAEIASEMMLARQEGTPMSKMIQFINDPSDGITESVKKVLRMIAVMAYKEPKYHTVERQAEAAEDFENTIFLDCYTEGS